MYKSVGSYNFILILLLSLILPHFGVAAQISSDPFAQKQTGLKLSLDGNQIDGWTYYNKLAVDKEESDRVLGVRYMVSGSLALLGGIAGLSVTADPLEKAIYGLFQTIGVASIGYGAHKYLVGDEKRLIMRSLRESTELSPQQKVGFLKIYLKEDARNKTNENYVKAVTHGLIAAMNFYNASQQKQESTKNVLNFIAGANLLAALSYSF